MRPRAIRNAALETPSRRAGFTLAEVMVALLVVGITLVLVLQGLNTAKRTTAHTHNRKVARELALLTLGQLEAGLFWEELQEGDDRLTGSYAEQDYEEFSWELAIGDESLPTYEDSESGYHDSYAYRRWQDDQDDEDEDVEEAAEPYERVSIRVTFPGLKPISGENQSERYDSITLERWIPWEQMYGVDEEGAELGESGGEVES